MALLKAKLVIFDLDGTLVDAYQAISQSLNFTLSKLRLPKQPFLKIKRAVGHGDASLILPFVGKKLLKKALLIYRKHHKISLKRKSRLLPGAKNILIYLKKNKIILCVASNRPRKFSGIILKNLKIDKYFSFILCADQINKPKPNPAIINFIRKRFAITKKETVYVGDMVVDIQAGRRAGVKTIAVLGGSSARGEIIKAKPDIVLENISGLKGIL